MAQKYSNENVFCVYGFEKNGLTDPAEIAQNSIEKNIMLKCPIIATDAVLAVDLFTQKYPDLMVAGIVNLADMLLEVKMMQDFKDSAEKE